MPEIPKAELAKKAFSSILATAVKVVIELPVGVVTGVLVTEGLLNTFSRVFAVAITCVKPTSPQLSGGVKGDSRPGMAVPKLPQMVRKLLQTFCVVATRGVMVVVAVTIVPN